MYMGLQSQDRSGLVTELMFQRTPFRRSRTVDDPPLITQTECLCDLTVDDLEFIDFLSFRNQTDFIL